MDSQQKRHEKDDHQGQCPGSRFKNPPDDESPGAAHQVMQHQQREAAQRNAEPKKIRDEVGAEELLDHRGDLSSSWRSCGAKSWAAAFWLNCSARMYATMAQRSRGLICAA